MNFDNEERRRLWMEFMKKDRGFSWLIHHFYGAALGQLILGELGWTIGLLVVGVYWDEKYGFRGTP